MAEEFNKLSQEQLNKLAKVIAEAKSLPGRQVEIIEEILAGEKDIGERRIAYLDEFFDAYSKKLDSIARRQSVLSDAYLILEKKAAQLRKQALEESNREIPVRVAGDKQGKKSKPATSKQATTDTSDTKQATPTKKTVDDGGNKKADAIKKRNEVKVTVHVAGNKEKEAPVSEETESGDSSGVSDVGAAIQATIERIAQACQQRIKSIEEAMEEAQDAIANSTEDTKQHQIEQYRKFAAEKERLETSLINIETLRHRTDIENTTQATSLRIAGAQEALVAEQNTRRLIQEGIEADIGIPGDERAVVEPELSTAELGPLVDIPTSIEAMRDALELSNQQGNEILVTQLDALKNTLQLLGVSDSDSSELKALSDVISTIDLSGPDISDDIEKLRGALQGIDLESPELLGSLSELTARLQTNIQDQVSLSSNIESLRQSVLSAEGTVSDAANDDSAIALRDALLNFDLDAPNLTSSIEALQVAMQSVDPSDAYGNGLALIANEFLAVADELAASGGGAVPPPPPPPPPGGTPPDGDDDGPDNGGLDANEAADRRKKADEEYEKALHAAEMNSVRRRTKNAIAEIEKEQALRAKNREEQWAILSKDSKELEKLKAIGIKEQEKREKALAAEAEDVQARILALRAKRFSQELGLENQQIAVNAAKLASAKKTLDAEEELNAVLESFNGQMAFSKDAGTLTGEVDEEGNATAINQAGQDRVDVRMAELKTDIVREQAAKADKWQKLEEAKIIQEKGELSAEDATRIQQEKAAKFSLDEETLSKLAKQQEQKDAKDTVKEARKELKEEQLKNINALKTGSFEERKEALKNLTRDEDGNFDSKKALAAATQMLADFAQKLEGTMDEIAKKKAPIDTRLNGSNNERFAGSYWDQITKDIMSVGAVTPFFKQADFASKVEELVGKGISFEVEQRAFLMTIQDKISTTFNVVDSTMLRLIRIQQENSTAGRMGMEIALNSFLNSMYETTEYLEGISESVRSNMAEMQALMTATAATEVEYEVQKWLGSLYSVGMSQDAVSAISNALGQIASGQIEGLTGDGAGNLLIMAANNAGLSIADIMTDGIDSSDTNKLLQATVNYLAELAEAAKDNKIVQQQLANVFGVKASDLKAATNLVSQDSVSTIFSNSMTYNSMIGQLYSMAGSMILRTSMAEMMQNVWDNAQYTIAAGMASTPIAYLTYKLAGLMDDTLGGIDLPFLNVYGFGIDLNTTVSDLMRVASMGAGILGSLGSVIAGLGNSFSGVAMLQQMGVGPGGPSVITRGNGSALAGGGGSSTSSSGSMSGNSSGSDVTDSTKQQAKDDGDEQMIEAEEEKKADRVDEINDNVLKIYELLADVAKGKENLKVKIEGYGLTGGSITGGGGAQGGVEALDNASSGGGSSSGGAAGGGSGGGAGGGGSAGGGAGSATNSGTSGGGGRSIDLGGWTML